MANTVENRIRPFSRWHVDNYGRIVHETENNRMDTTGWIMLGGFILAVVILSL